MELEVLKAYADAMVKIEKLKAHITALAKENKTLKAENKRKVFIEEVFYLSMTKDNAFTITDKEPEIVEYLKELENENS